MKTDLLIRALENAAQVCRYLETTCNAEHAEFWRRLAGSLRKAITML